jgi:hypothetical protein
MKTEKLPTGLSLTMATLCLVFWLAAGCKMMENFSFVQNEIFFSFRWAYQNGRGSEEQTLAIDTMRTSSWRNSGRATGAAPHSAHEIVYAWCAHPAMASNTLSESRSPQKVAVRRAIDLFLH